MKCDPQCLGRPPLSPMGPGSKVIRFECGNGGFWGPLAMRLVAVTALEEDSNYEN